MDRNCIPFLQLLDGCQGKVQFQIPFCGLQRQHPGRVIVALPTLWPKGEQMEDQAASLLGHRPERLTKVEGHIPLYRITAGYAV
jgi:hypothetical protein